jgi:hypothetical protein
MVVVVPVITAVDSPVALAAAAVRPGSQRFGVRRRDGLRCLPAMTVLVPIHATHACSPPASFGEHRRVNAQASPKSGKR